MYNFSRQIPSSRYRECYIIFIILTLLAIEAFPIFEEDSRILVVLQIARQVQDTFFNLKNVLSQTRIGFKLSIRYFFLRPQIFNPSEVSDHSLLVKLRILRS